MSNIAIKGATTGTGVFTIESPATNTDRTLTLPDEAGTVLTSGGPISVGGLVTLTNGGIKFPASQVASADANTLDDYEEGTWTPVVRGSTTAGSYTYTGGYGTYTKIGNQVTISFLLLDITEVSAGTGYLQITGAPFTKPGSTYFVGSVSAKSTVFATGTTYCTLEFITASSTSILYVHQLGNNSSGGDLLLSQLTSGSSDLGGTITYFV